MNLPFDAMPGAAFISELSPDIIPDKIREYQEKMKVPCLCELGCRFLTICVAMSSPESIIDIGCGIGASTTALYMGAPKATITALDANIDRYNICVELTSEQPNTKVYHSLAIPFLRSTNDYYDFAFVDTVKKDYMGVWKALRPRLREKATVVFDDVLLHGYTTEDESLVPIRYRDGRNELRLFLTEISQDQTVLTQLIPIGGGMLIIKLK